jgi:protein-S-isoprenylcysteine O-methyltransferase Ste14
MFARALLAFLALPGVVAFAIPVAWLYWSRRTTLVHPIGLVPLLTGVAALLWCVRDFYVSGRGTLAPWAPPMNLVVVGLYRHTRNPMYLAAARGATGQHLATVAVRFGSLAIFCRHGGVGR